MLIDFKNFHKFRSDAEVLPPTCWKILMKWKMRKRARTAMIFI
ncbi:hypothetical protein PR003_g24796 [Phytophthora rubi]|uniref:Uncharacterized protein n=1 Tax=Phytophthora rubi TaxID=129364 RepID=A0A6A3LGC0_9STRA|nr:hypothetical protein PR002_g13076 [Phytophthora rubi]KAE9292276.1 hypothetical protein PR003_g24796 [Phytophthora rubi]